MDQLDVILAGIAASAGVLVPVLYALFAAALIDTLTGSWAAFASGNFSWQYVAEFLKSHVLFKITPILLQLISAVALGGTDSAAGLALVATGSASAAAYLASVVASVAGNVTEGRTKTKGLPSGISGEVKPTPTSDDDIK